MKNIFKIAVRNLLRYKRRTLLTSLLIIIGVVMVVVFSGISKSFKDMMIGTITDSMLGHMQIHKKGYVSSIDNLPLHLNLNENQIEKLTSILDENEKVIEAYTFRIKFGAMLSNYEQTTNIRLSAVNPEMENKASPALVDKLPVEYYGTMTALNQIASIAAPELRLLVIRPWDPSALPDIERAILKSDLGLTPMNDGKLIRLSIPRLTEERRRDLVKVARKQKVAKGGK